ncbi:hypothetical protein SCOCK_220061 [Actinacidiphila cocklensis]|uniref:Uncharacterized protein n=1 Tax=Actinacidiphila cocklensis TaxID=887465 RepID=A0A9W4DTR0_9ACTN|nr:hypothetical protein SCOCK_220061 [Actinacidiphila cocklensis]
MHRGEGGEVAEVVAAVEDAAGVHLAQIRRQGDALVHTGRAQLQDVASRLDHQVVVGGELGQWDAQRLEGGVRVLGAAGVDGDRPAALVLDPGAPPGAVAVEEAGQLRADRGDAGVGAGVVHLGGVRVPALGTVVAEDDEVVQGGDPGEAAVADGHTGRAAGDHGHRRDVRREPRQRRDRARVGAGLLRIGHDRGERAVEIQRHDRALRLRQQRVESYFALRRAGRRNLGVTHDSDLTVAPCPRGYPPTPVPGPSRRRSEPCAPEDAGQRGRVGVPPGEALGAELRDEPPTGGKVPGRREGATRGEEFSVRSGGVRGSRGGD